MFRLPVLLLAGALASVGSPASAIVSGPVPVPRPSAASTPAASTPDVLTGPHAAQSAVRPAAGTALGGILHIAPGTCSGAVTGSWFRMVVAGGGPDGPYVSNNDSPCSDKAVSVLSPGTAGGLNLSAFQPDPTPAFDGAGNGLARDIIVPITFFGVKFAVSTQPQDPQTGTTVPLPLATIDGATLSADLRAVSVSWNDQHFNQGAPKPDGSRPGLTHQSVGTYDASTGHYVVEWYSQIVGGPFNGFTGRWHLEGTGVPPKASGASGAQPSRTAGSATAPATVRAPAVTPATTTSAPLAQTGLAGALPWLAVWAFLGAAVLRRRPS